MKHEDYVNVIEANKALKKEVVSIRSCNHQLYTFERQKIALKSFYDMVQLVNNINCIPYGYNTSTEIPPKEPNTKPDEEEEFELIGEKL